MTAIRRWTCGLCLWLFWIHPAQAWVAYQTEHESFRLEFRGYLKNFLAIQTGLARFLPESPPADLKGWADTFRLLFPNTPTQDLTATWNQFRKELDTSTQNQIWLRLGILMKIGGSATLQMAYELRPWIGNQPQRLLQAIPVLGSLATQGLFGNQANLTAGFGAFTSFEDRYLDFPSTFVDQHNIRLQHMLDRLFFSYSFSVLDLTIGRQPISMGIGRVFRPNDVLAPFSPYEFDTEQRRGVDAIKIEIPLGDVSELMLIGALQRLYPSCPRKIGEDLTLSAQTTPGCRPNSTSTPTTTPTTIGYFDDPSPAGLARLKWNIKGVDMFAMTGYVHQDFVAGFGISASVFGAGIQGEFLYRYPIVKPEEQHPGGLWNLSLNLEYNIAKINVLLGLSYFHQSVGSTQPSAYLTVAQSYRYFRGESFLLGTDYLALYWQWQIHPLLAFSGSVILNLLDPSAILAPTLVFNPLQDLHITAGAYIGIGAFPQFVTENNNAKLSLASEFGAVGVLFLLGLRYYY